MVIFRHQRSFAYLAAHSCSVPFMLILILCESLLVATFSCTTSILIKWKQFFTIQSLKLASFTATVLTFLPSVVQQVLAPSRKGFLYGLMNSSCSFYLFSFQGKFNYFHPLFVPCDNCLNHHLHLYST